MRAKNLLSNPKSKAPDNFNLISKIFCILSPTVFEGHAWKTQNSANLLLCIFKQLNEKLFGVC